MRARVPRFHPTPIQSPLVRTEEKFIKKVQDFKLTRFKRDHKFRFPCEYFKRVRT